MNENLGRKEGDKLLYKISRILKNICGNDDIVSRWGGDEFVILIKEKEKIYVENLIENIKNACEKIEEFLSLLEEEELHSDTFFL